MASSPSTEAPPRSWFKSWLASPRVSRLIAGCLIVVLIGIIALESQSLWSEWRLLLSDLGETERSTVIGYREITPLMSYAQRPPNWFHDEPGESLLWQRWVDGVGHRWFHLGKGDLDPSHITGSDFPFHSRPIDDPIIETQGGEIWTRLPGQATVVVAKLGDATCVYPLPVLAKVQVVNDVIQGHPYLIVCDCHSPVGQAVSVYDALWDGRRATMAATGYYFDQHPLLYDRRTQSLWREQDDGLVSMAGKAKGTRLARLEKPVPTAWKDCIGRAETVRLVVGADRSRELPTD